VTWQAFGRPPGAARHRATARLIDSVWLLVLGPAGGSSTLLISSARPPANAAVVGAVQAYGS
jgi:hypothetical protein